MMSTLKSTSLSMPFVKVKCWELFVQAAAKPAANGTAAHQKKAVEKYADPAQASTAVGMAVSLINAGQGFRKIPSIPPGIKCRITYNIEIQIQAWYYTSSRPYRQENRDLSTWVVASKIQCS